MFPEELTDQSKIPFGKHEGEKLANVPARYLLYIFENFKLHDNLKAYIKKNKEVLEAEVKRANQQMRR
jgi:uncharacterized protein (DUF3820 family)